MKYKIDYLLRYISMDTYNKLLLEKNNYTLELLQDNYIDVDLNIKYLIRYGVSNIDRIILYNIEDLIIEHNEFIKKINSYEMNLTKDEVITLLENL